MNHKTEFSRSAFVPLFSLNDAVPFGINLV